MIASLFAALLIVFAPAHVAQDKYAAGQVWSYETRPQDRGSVLVVREVENHPQLGHIYHVSILGIHVRGGDEPVDIQHAPVSRETLDASVVRLSDGKPVLPDYQEGLKYWREAEGGVFTIPVAEIVDLIDQTVPN